MKQARYTFPGTLDTQEFKDVVKLPFAKLKTMANMKELFKLQVNGILIITFPSLC